MSAQPISVTRQPASSISTPHQRLHIRTLMQQLDLDTRHMTGLHRRFFKAAALPQPEPNAHIDAVLCALKKHEASALIGALKAEVDDG